MINYFSSLKTGTNFMIYIYILYKIESNSPGKPYKSHDYLAFLHEQEPCVEEHVPVMDY